MAKAIDLTGKTFSKLTVISKDVERNNQLKKERSLGLRTNAPTHWICRCECGNEVSVASQRLRSGKTTSCGCNYKKYDFENKDMIGKKINSWTIISYSHFDKKNKKHYFNCECDCGTLQIVDGYNLIQELSQNCGCKRKATLKEIRELDLCGQTFGRLTAISKVGFTKARKVIYECQCECGQITNAVGSSLISGHTYSCGCILSKQNIKIAEVLENIGIDFNREKTFKTKNSVVDLISLFLLLTQQLNMMENNITIQLISPVREKNGQMKISKLPKKETKIKMIIVNLTI